VMLQAARAALDDRANGPVLHKNKMHDQNRTAEAAVAS